MKFLIFVFRYQRFWLKNARFWILDSGYSMVVMVHWLTGPAPISRELSSIGAGSALRYEILDVSV